MNFEAFLNLGWGILVRTVAQFCFGFSRVFGPPRFRSHESGSGWPSLWQPLAEDRVAEEEDHGHGMVRIEALCSQCDAHLGHVFPDGPRPTGLRYCMNSAALRFERQE